MEQSNHSFTVLLGKQIRNRRKKLGLSQEELAEKLGVGHQALSRIEQGKMAPKMERLPILAKSLHCTVSDLFRFDEGDSSDYATRIADLLATLPSKKREFIYDHVASLAFLLKLDE